MAVSRIGPERDPDTGDEPSERERELPAQYEGGTTI